MTIQSNNSTSGYLVKENKDTHPKRIIFMANFKIWKQSSTDK